MKGDYCRFCNHHARDHVISEQNDFELVDEEKMIVYDSTELRLNWDEGSMPNIYN